MICNVEDYVSVNRCFKCSGYNHRHTECKSEETCPLCAGKHKLKECTAPRSEYKCMNCVKYNLHNKDRKAQENHISLDRSCPSLQAMIEKYRQTQTTKMAQTDHSKKRTIHGQKNIKPQTPIRCMQINLQHSRIATDNLMKLIEQEKSDIIFTQEPYLYKHRMTGITNSYRSYNCC